MSCISPLCDTIPQRLVRILAVAAIAACFAETSAPAEVPWTTLGPDGGDARSLAFVPSQPAHLYLGTTNSWIYESLDQGGTWHRLAELDPSEDVVIDNIVVDAANPNRIWAGGWKPDQRDGGLWGSQDGGHSWKAIERLRGQSIFALAQAPSNPRVIFAGTWEGVFRSSDSGVSWSLISPADSKEIHEVESLAVDPHDPDIVYAGTWHLPWKTTDGGKNWSSIKQGVIEDSDVFSIIIDPAKPRTIFLSACSGIYKSENAGSLFKKIQGIPSTARRTRVLMQDPSNREVVYAGTTEGLYKTSDGGRNFTRMTGPDVIVNDVFVDPGNPSHVLIATDRGGVLASTDGGASFTPANEGFSGRKVEALLVDRTDPSHLYAGVVNDKSYGGVFASTNGGVTWKQLGQGLEGRDVFALAQDPDGTIWAGTSKGIFALGSGAADTPATWQAKNLIANTVIKAATETHAGKRINIEKQVKAAVVELQSRVRALDVSGDVWVASTTYGLLTSRDKGESWQGGLVMGSGDYTSVTVHGSNMAAARSEGVVLSTDSGRTWIPMSIPSMLTRIHRVAFSDDGTLWLGAREGVYFTRDSGKSWLWMERFPFRDVDDLCFDAHTGKILASSRSSDQIYAINPKTLAWKWWQTGYRICVVRAAGERVIAASLFDGVLIEPTAALAESGGK